MWLIKTFKDGRYPIHLYLSGRQDKSWIKGNSVHHSFARLISIHGYFFNRNNLP